MAYPNLTACSSGPEARICIQVIAFERKPFEVCGNVGEYNTLDLVKHNTKKKKMFLFVPSSLKSKRKAIMYYSSTGVI